ncbi:putative spore wall protein 4, partial [Nosema bombycis CQ1]
MNMKLVPILLCAIFCTRRDPFPEIDMTKLYNITVSIPSTTAGAAPTIRNITEKIPGLFVCFDNDEESIVIKVNTTPDNTLAQDLSIIIAPADNVKPNLLTIKTYDDLLSAIQINENDNGQIIINLTRSSPEGESFLLIMVKLNNVVAVNKLLSEFDHTFKLLRKLFCKREVPEQSVRNLCNLYHAKKARHHLAKCCPRKEVVAINIVGECDKFDICDKFEVEEVCKPKVCFKEDEYSLCIINAIAVKILFETFNYSADCSKDALTKYAQTVCAIKSCVDVREAAVILYQAVTVFTEIGLNKEKLTQAVLQILTLIWPVLLSPTILVVILVVLFALFIHLQNLNLFLKYVMKKKLKKSARKK